MFVLKNSLRIKSCLILQYILHGVIFHETSHGIERNMLYNICTFTVDNIQVKFNEISLQKNCFLLNKCQVHVCNMGHSFFLLPWERLKVFGI